MMEVLPYIVFGAGALFVVVSLFKSVRVISAKNAYVVERLGKYNKTLEAGFHILLPFLDKVRYKHSLKEVAVDVPAQSCFTQDNVKVAVDGVLYLQVVDPKKASYGIQNYKYATIQLAQTTMRSVIGRLELDRTFEERDAINAEVVSAVDEASDPWGIKVSRYEIQNITVPKAILNSMEVQMRAEREKRALIARSIGEMEANINSSQAEMEEAINKSEGEKQKRVNEAEGSAAEILAVAKATADGIRKVAEAIQAAGSTDAITLRLAETYINELKKVAKNDTKLVLPMDLTDMNSVIDNIDRLVENSNK